MTSKFSIRSQFDLLHEQLSLFCEELQQSDIIKSTYFELPKIEKEQEEKAPLTIEVNKVSGQEATKMIVSAYKDLFIDHKVSGKVVQRHPGIISINDPKGNLQARLKAVNEAKQKFKELILEIPNNDARFDAVHSAVPSLITIAGYRKIHSETAIPYSVRFTWMTKHATRTLSKEAALDMLSRSSNYSNPRMIDQQSWQSLVEQEKIRVNSLGANSKLRIRRPTRVSPEVNVRFTAQKRYHVSAALPFILFNPHPETKLGDLSNYEKVDNHPRKRAYNFLVDRIYLEKVD
ncbi:MULTISPECIES: DNA replication terminus site-binding protein [Pseudoalteromonas]|uniref:DNA replication terminus site-binding protein n=1 Tax=Pseudoalteromonas amylolytica TaxID=1859457 RepID=A0A1S1MNC7_9GAMM|nr:MULTISPECIES: DNA replication terminus site-binding protein [Pseudoalteromonas]OHU85133.1 DNA replication terminus site-binding protein [Pseudoalteromonas sp. JW3]OHU89916.1 DNA replication terminus site-binding protein [Pseudoalteromonas amylolytica]